MLRHFPGLDLTNRLGPLFNDRLNYFTPTRTPIEWRANANGWRARIYDDPATPLLRLLAASALSPGEQVELSAGPDRLKPVEIARQPAPVKPVDPTRAFLSEAPKKSRQHLAARHLKA